MAQCPIPGVKTVSFAVYFQLRANLDLIFGRLSVILCPYLLNTPLSDGTPARFLIEPPLTFSHPHHRFLRWMKTYVLLAVTTWLKITYHCQSMYVYFLYSGGFSYPLSCVQNRCHATPDTMGPLERQHLNKDPGLASCSR